MDTTIRQPVLVTGASGFIGGRLVRRLVERHDRVLCLVRAESRVDALRSAGAELVGGDVTDPGSVARALSESRAGTVFHLAGLVRARRHDEFTRVNSGGVANVGAACAALARPPVLVVVSSLAAAGPSSADRARVEVDAAAPVSNYGRSKLAGELAAARHAEAVPITIVRPPIVFGPGDRAVLEVFRPIARWGVHFVPGWRRAGAGDCRVSLVHVDDLVEGLLLAAEKGERLGAPGPPGHGVFYIAGEEHPTYAMLGQAIAGALGRKPPAMVRVPSGLLRMMGIGGELAALLRRRPGWINRDKVAEALAESWTCGSTKARTHLGWAPRSGATLDDRLRETAQWYRQAGWL